MNIFHFVHAGWKLYYNVGIAVNRFYFVHSTVGHFVLNENVFCAKNRKVLDIALVDCGNTAAFCFLAKNLKNVKFLIFFKILLPKIEFILKVVSSKQKFHEENS